METVRLPDSVELRPRLGSLLVRKGLLTPDQLEQALEEKAEHPGRLGEIFLEHGWVSEEALARTLADQHGLQFLDLTASPPESTVLRLLPEQFARRLCAIPVMLLGDETVLVAVADPTDVVVSDDLHMALGMNVRLAISEGSQIMKVIDGTYGSARHAGSSGEQVAIRRTEAIDQASTADDTAPAIEAINGLLRRAIAEGASDLHFEPQARGLVARARIDGVMREIDLVPSELKPAVVSRLKVMGGLDIAERRAPQDGRVPITLAGRPMDLRMAVLPTPYGEQVVLRILDLGAGSDSRDLGGLGMADDTLAAFKEMLARPYGCIVVCGPTGSGKTTTLYGALDVLNDRERVLMTIEDPIESRIAGINQIEVNVRAGLTFERGLRTILRSDPDVLLVGEVRDAETAVIAIQAALTGHLVLTTLHAQDTASSIARLKDIGISSSLLATSVNCVIAQRLARRLCQDCREPYELPRDAIAGEGGSRGHGEALAGTGPLVLYRARGCASCARTGYDGRVGLYELLQLTGAIRRLLDASTDEIYAAATQSGMRTLYQDGLRLALEGVTSLEEVQRVTAEWIA